MSPHQYSCSICCDDVPIEDKCVLTNCAHDCCRSCMKHIVDQWQANPAPSSAAPICPFCRTDVASRDVQGVQHAYGCPLPPPLAASTSDCSHGTDESEDLTLRWIQSNTRPCPSCGTRIERPEDGSSTLGCICGCIFGWDSASEPQVVTAPAVETRSATTTTTPEDETEMDEYTRNWLQEHTTCCPRCDIRIERTGNQYDDMVCVACACVFCFSCGAEAGRCHCTDAVFWYNLSEVDTTTQPSNSELCEELQSSIASTTKAAANNVAGALNNPLSSSSLPSNTLAEPPSSSFQPPTLTAGVDQRRTQRRRPGQPDEDDCPRPTRTRSRSPACYNAGRISPALAA